MLYPLKDLLIHQYKVYKSEHDPYLKVNNNERLREYLIDLHGGHTKQEAEELYQEYCNKILIDVRANPSKLNIPEFYAKRHLIKVVCGKGKHSAFGVGVLKEHFRTLLKEAGKNFAYLENYGVFLIIEDV